MDYDPESVLIRPAKGSKDPPVSRDTVLCMTKPLLGLLAERIRGREHNISPYGLYSMFQAEEEDSGRPVLTLAGPFLGAPQAVLGLEKMVALGAERLLVAGLCGSLQDGIHIGDLIVPVGAFSEEGTSRHYGQEGDIPPADSELSRLLMEEARLRGARCASGPVWTTDAPYRETRGKVVEYRRKGAVAVEMELAALLTVARFRGVRLAGMMAVSDELFSLEWRSGFSSRALREGMRVMVDVLLGALKKV